MRAHLDVVERRWRKIAMNPKASVKQRKTALDRMKVPSDTFLCRMLKKCTSSPALEFAVTEKLAALREKAFLDKL